MNELIEARYLVEELEHLSDRLSIQDRRFTESWRSFLDRNRDEAQIGRNRLAILQQVAADYGIEINEAAPEPTHDDYLDVA